MANSLRLADIANIICSTRNYNYPTTLNILQTLKEDKSSYTKAATRKRKRKRKRERREREEEREKKRERKEKGRSKGKTLSLYLHFIYYYTQGLIFNIP
jgi:predicted nucleotidyltransferase